MGTLDITFLTQIDLKIDQNVCFDEGLDEFEFWSAWSVGRIKIVHCGHSRSYNLYLIDKFSSQLGNKSGLTVFAQLTRKLDQIHFVGKLTQMSNLGPSWPFCYYHLLCDMYVGKIYFIQESIPQITL